MARETSHNHIITDENKRLFNEDSVRLLDEFMIYLQTIGRAEGTIEGYRNDIEMFFVWNLEKNKNKFFIDVTKKDIMFFQNYCMNVLKVGSARYRHMRSALSSMSNYIENMCDDEYPTFKNIVNRVEAPPKKAVRKKSVFTDDELQVLLDYLVENKQYEKACCLALAMSGGARKSELLRFKTWYFDDENLVYGSLYQTPEKIITKGRGGKPLTKYTLKSKFKPYLDLWMNERKRLGIESEWLFVNKDGTTQRKATSLDKWANQFTKMLNKDFYWHSMRHNCCTYLSKAGIPHSVIKDLFGWESVDMCLTYDDSELSDKLGEYFSTEGIKKAEKKSLTDL